MNKEDIDKLKQGRNKQKLLISFSGGRTSAYMTWWLINEWDDRDNWEIIVVFANTGKEVEGTLFFVDECSQEWNIPIVWVEAVPVSKKGWKVAANIVTYETASRHGEPFEAMIEKLGIPNSEGAAFCSPQLKRQAIISYAKNLGWKNYYVAIGVRYDEPKRVNRKQKKQKILYPFVDIFPTIKRDVFIFWSKQSFDLNIHPDEGNCDNCLKKGLPILCRNMNRNPKSFNWWENTQNKYNIFNPRKNEDKTEFNFFRGNRTVEEIRQISKLTELKIIQTGLFESENGCSESCEAF